MRFFAPLLAALAAVAAAQQQNAINTPLGGLQVTAGQPTTITWSNPSSGTVTIRLTQGGDVTPGSGILLASNIPASAETATFTISADEVNNSQYNFEIIDDSNSGNINFSSPFTVTGATGTGSATTASGSSSTGTATSTGTSTNSASVSSSASSASSSASKSASSAMSSASRSASSAASAASSSASTATTTSAPNSNDATHLASMGGFLVALAGAIVAF